ncbi:hypothetical protein Rhe02_87130 [Rhizocola hellebori]|uniref:Uncharacterized protein n=1 Tax=Rhizocola hellebori TaxID=1392758 RepID=A0A8J3VLZ4_9ACTN|nr:hypothetical protein [Rhizocola hellebori]GIH10646.1 hypothetical protein Rhe02_87130 [Rhizocola hellebori]
MTAPTAGFAVETTKLLDEAKIWETESLEMENIGKKADVLEFTDQGLYTLFIPKYHLMVNAVVARCNEALVRMGEIRDTLGHIATTYEATEERHAQQLGTVSP